MMKVYHGDIGHYAGAGQADDYPRNGEIALHEEDGLLSLVTCCGNCGDYIHVDIVELEKILRQLKRTARK